jgi:hypothetical protein
MTFTHQNDSVKTLYALQVASGCMQQVELAEEFGLISQAAAYRQQAERAHSISKQLPASTYYKAARRGILIFFHRQDAPSAVRSQWVDEFFRLVAEEQQKHAQALDYPELGIIERKLLAAI